MNKYTLRGSLLILLSGLFLLTACRSRKMATGTPRPMVESSVQDLLDSISDNSFSAQWFNAKASVTTISNGSETSFNISMRSKRDSVIWISISPLLGIEVARVIITPDSVKFIDRLHGNYKVNSFEAINKLLQLKVNFEIVQSLLTGNFFAYKKNENKFNSVYLEDKYYILSSLNKKKLRRALEEKDPNKPVIQDVYVDPQNYRINQVRVEDQKIHKALAADYSDFRPSAAGLFPYRLDTKITAEKNFEIRIEYSKLTVGEVQEFPFTIPASYERER